jgi:hypothetical protein
MGENLVLIKELKVSCLKIALLEDEDLKRASLRTGVFSEAR